MKYASKLLRPITLIIALLAPALAQAHPGHAHDSFAAGALHPLSGADHLLVLFGAAWLAARLAAPTLRVLGALFIGALGASAAAHADGGVDAWAFLAGVLLTSVGLIAVLTTVLIPTGTLIPRKLTSSARRSPTSAAASAPAPRPTSSH